MGPVPATQSWGEKSGVRENFDTSSGADTPLKTLVIVRAKGRLESSCRPEAFAQWIARRRTGEITRGGRGKGGSRSITTEYPFGLLSPD